MKIVGLSLIGIPGLILFYAYVGYPLLLRVLSAFNSSSGLEDESPNEWPFVSVSLPAYNEEGRIRGAIEALLTADYPSDRLQIVVVSDASTDGTDAIVREYEDEGVELIRQEDRGGKTAAENAALPHLHGEIVVNTDASVRVHPGALKALVRQFSMDGLGVASGRDLSVGRASNATDVNAGEAGYVGYEMWVRSLETRLGGIVGASGCLYAIRRELHELPVPEHLSRDFSAALTARRHGYRAVSVDDAQCLVPRTDSLRAEFRRKVRTITRGLQTLSHNRALLNPARYGRFAWKLWSHKVARWLGAAVTPLAALGLLIWSLESVLALSALILLIAGLLGAIAAVRRPEAAGASRIARACAYLYTANAAATWACWRALREERDAVWEPTRR